MCKSRLNWALTVRQRLKLVLIFNQKGEKPIGDEDAVGGVEALFLQLGELLEEAGHVEDDAGADEVEAVGVDEAGGEEVKAAW